MFSRRQIILFFISAGLLCFFFILPPYRSWAGRLLSYWRDFMYEKDHLSLEKRKQDRYENAYIYSAEIASFIRREDVNRNLLVLLPPSAYFRNYGISYPVPEPAVFYYFTGIKTVWVNSKEALKADWMVAVSNGNLVMQKITDMRVLQDSIRSFRKFPVSL